MSINYLTNFERDNKEFLKNGEGRTLFKNKNIYLNAKVYALGNTIFSKELSLLDNSFYDITCDNCELIILSEPMSDELNPQEIKEIQHRYIHCIKKAEERKIPILHIVSNETWYSLFEDIIDNFDIKVFIPQSIQERLRLPEKDIVNIKEFIYLESFINYSNEINNKILLDLTQAHDKDYHYKLNFSSLLNQVKTFSSVDILINDNTFIPEFSSGNINVYKISEYSLDRFKDISYVYYHTNKPYNMNDVGSLLFYSANSKIIYSNYNYFINNLLPSVIMNLSKSKYNIEILPEKEAFDIMNENRNTILFNNTSINIFNDLCNMFLNKHFVNHFSLSNVLDEFSDNLFIKNNNSSNKIKVEMNSFKYDMEKTLTLPILFLGESSVRFGDNKASCSNYTDNFEIPFYKKRKQLNNVSEKELSMIVPIHNNGRYLKYKCFNSILGLSCLEKLEIIFIDDGSNDGETIRIIKDILSDYPGIVYKKFEKGSGSASRPRNVGMDIASCKYVTFLDPDNEAIEDGYTILLDELIENEKLDMIVADIVREDNIKRNDISYYKKVMKVQKLPFISETKKLLFETNLSVQSIQALIVKKEIIDVNNLKMIEGAAGQDTLFFQELLLKCRNVKVLNQNVHSYYAYVEGSVTNTVSHKFFEKFYKVEIERKKFLEREKLINFYMDIRFNSYMKNWYFEKLKQVKSVEDERKAKDIILKIFKLYEDYSQYFNEDSIKIQNICLVDKIH